MCAVCQVDMGAPSVGDYAASHSLLLRALPHQVNPCDLYAPPEHLRSKTKPRSQTLLKSSNNASHDHDGQKIRVVLMLNLFRQLDQAGYGLSQGP